MKRTALIFFFVACFLPSLFAQIKINGKVTDTDTGEPLAGASVFAQGTTQGTITDQNGQYSLTLKEGGYELIFSFTGYQNKEIRVTESRQLDLSMMKQDNTLSEVVVQSSNEVRDGWEKYGTFFIDHFIGATPFAASCKIQNPDVVKFFYYRKSDKLKVLATEPLVISNDALGYDLRYQLDSFVYYYKTDLGSYRGNCLFAEKLGTVNQALSWKANREKAYYGSKLHFMRSIYDSTLKENNFTISILDENDKTKFLLLQNPVTPKYYTVVDSVSEVELHYPAKISVTYLKSVPETEYLKQSNLPLDVGVQVSYIDILKPIAIKQNGYYYDQRNWVNQGYWSWKNVADLLPFDYMP